MLAPWSNISHPKKSKTQSSFQGELPSYRDIGHRDVLLTSDIMKLHGSSLMLRMTGNLIHHLLPLN